MIKAIEDIPRGDEIYFTYGRKSNAKFFMRYGFLIPDNEANTIELKVPLDKKDPALQLKINIAKKDSEKFLCVKTFEDENMFKLMSWLRFVCFEDGEVDEKKINLENMILNTEQNPFSLKNEIKVLNLLKKLVTKHLGAYPNSYEEDIKML